MTRPARPGSKELGLGWPHAKARTAAIKALVPGTPCPRCGRGMYPTPRAARAAGLPRILWPLDLGDWPGRIHGGPQAKRLEHAHCNRRAGQATAAAIRAGKLRGRPRGSVQPAPPSTRARRRARWYR